MHQSTLHSLAMTVGGWIGSSCAEAFCLPDSGWCSSSCSSISGPGLGSWSHSGSISGHKFMSPSLSDGVGASASAAVYTREENKLGNRFLSEPYSFYYHSRGSASRIRLCFFTFEALRPVECTKITAATERKLNFIRHPKVKGKCSVQHIWILIIAQMQLLQMRWANESCHILIRFNYRSFLLSFSRMNQTFTA